MNNKSYQTFIGIDVAKSKLDLFDSSTGQTCTVNNSVDEIQPLIESWSSSGGKLLVVMEATGGYEALLAQLLMKQPINAL